MRTWTIILIVCSLVAAQTTLAGDLQAGNSTGSSTPALATADRMRTHLAAYEAAHLRGSPLFVGAAARGLQPPQSQPKGKSWIGRHPVLLGTAVGFGAGFAYGYGTGDPGARNCPSCDNATPETKAVVFGGIGAGIGALAGFIIGAVRK